MKKYYKLISLLLVIVVVFPIFYVQNNALSQSYPQFKIKTLEGDESLANQVVLKGDLYDNYNTNEAFKIKEKATEYVRDASLFTRLEDYYVPEQVLQLRKDHRSFMRMKHDDGDAYLEKDDTIIYVSIPYTRWGVLKGSLQIETYDTRTKERQKTEIDAGNLLEYAYVDRMFMGDDYLYISVMNSAYDVNYEEERTVLHLYAYDFETEAIVETYEIEMNEASLYSDFMNVFVDDEHNPTDIIVSGTAIDYEAMNLQEELAFEEGELAEEFEAEVEAEDYEEVIALQTIERIDLETGEISEIEIDQFEKNSIPVAYNGQEIIFAKVKKDKLIYMTYDMETKKVDEKITVETDTPYISLWELEDNIVKNDRMYTLINNDQDQTATLIVIDTEKVELLYIGKVEGDLTQRDKKQDMEFYFHTLEVVD